VSSQPPKLVIFDCDGVLVDSERISNGVLADMLSAEGLATTLTEARAAYQGLQLAQVREAAERRLGRDLDTDFLERFERERAAVFAERLEAVEGAEHAVRSVRDSGIGVCVASQAGLQKTRTSLALTGLAALFDPDALFSAAQVPRGKPHPDLFLHAAETMGAEPSRCAVVEDTASGVTAAVAAGMRAIGYTADSDAAALKAAGAELLDSLFELPAALGLGVRRESSCG
jgi:HAD superfamily hydrolase (TIGR01509 family)